MAKIKINDKERDAILAGLRLLQENSENLPPMIGDIYTNCGEHSGLSFGEIDHLCEKINVSVD